MEPTATPWRVLEDSPQRTAGSAAPSGAAAARPSPVVARSTAAIGAGAVLLAVLAFFLAFGAGSGGTVVLDGGAPLGSAVPVELGDAGGAPATAPADLVVEIVGAVLRPGVYRVAPDARIGELVTAAGGYGARVDANRASRELNLAARLHDGDQIRVPSRDDEATVAEPLRSGEAVSGTGAASALVDLNRATAAELEALPGIGPVTAGKILTSREEQPFAAVDDLRTRKLVGEKTFETIKSLVAVR